MTEPLEKIEKGWPIIKKAPWHFTGAFLAVVIPLGLLMAWLFGHTYSGTISEKDARIDRIGEERDAVLRENERLSKQIENLRIYRGPDAPPLKQKAVIFSRQVREFTKDWKETDSQEVKRKNVDAYLERFGLRAQILRDDFDVSGQHSDEYDRLIFHFGYTYEDVYAIADEVERLSNALPDPTGS